MDKEIKKGKRHTALGLFAGFFTMFAFGTLGPLPEPFHGKIDSIIGYIIGVGIVPGVIVFLTVSSKRWGWRLLGLLLILYLLLGLIGKASRGGGIF